MIHFVLILGKTKNVPNQRGKNRKRNRLSSSNLSLFMNQPKHKWLSLMIAAIPIHDEVPIIPPDPIPIHRIEGQVPKTTKGLAQKDRRRRMSDSAKDDKSNLIIILVVIDDVLE